MPKYAKFNLNAANSNFPVYEVIHGTLASSFNVAASKPRESTLYSTSKNNLSRQYHHHLQKLEADFQHRLEYNFDFNIEKEGFITYTYDNTSNKWEVIDFNLQDRNEHIKIKNINTKAKEDFEKLKSLGVPVKDIPILLERLKLISDRIDHEALLVAATSFNLAASVYASSPAGLAPKIAAVVPAVRFKTRPDLSVGAIELYLEHWMPAVEAGITVKQLSDIDDAILPAMREEKKKLGRKAPKIRWPNKDRKADKIYADTPEGRERKNRELSGGSRRSRESYKRRKAQLTP